MISLYKEGVYLLNGTEIIPESEASRAPQLFVVEKVSEP